MVRADLQIGNRHACRLSGVIGNGQVDLQQPYDRGDQPLALAQRQSKHRPQGRHSFDGEIGIVTLTARRCSRLRLPACHRVGRKPEGKVSAISKGRVILTPIGDLMTLTKNITPAFRKKLKGRDRLPTRKLATISAAIINIPPLGPRCNKVAPFHERVDVSFEPIDLGMDSAPQLLADQFGKA
jgi:hypothetical protein